MVKRKSLPGAGPGQKAKVQRKFSAEQLQDFPHVKKITNWLSEVVIPCGGAARWLEQKYPTQDDLMGFAAWLDERFPASDSHDYSADLEEGPKLLRPWMLAFRSDFGLSQVQEPDQLIELAEMFLMEGFRTNSDLPGVEKVACIAVSDNFLEKPYRPLPCLHAGYILRLCRYVKGYRRCLTALVVADGIRSLDLFDELTPTYKSSMRTVFGTVANFETLRDVVHCNRGISMGAASTRKLPNAFTFCRQIDVLRKAGEETASFEEWGSASAIMKAFRIGKFESAAIANLQENMPKPVSEALKEAVRVRGMKQFVLHETIAKDIFNSAWTSGTGTLEQWSSQLTNTESNELALLLIERMKADWDRSSSKKPWAVKETSQLHVLCGGFIHYMAQFQAKVAECEYEQHRESLRKSFLNGFLDTDLDHGLLSPVPPGDLGCIAMMRTIVEESQSKIVREMEQKEQELAEKIANATLEQLRMKINMDMDLLRKLAPSAANDAIEASLDCKWLKDRQLKGQAWVRKWMDERFQLILQPDGNMSQVLGQFAKFSAEAAKGGENLRTMVLVDATVYPANAQYLTQALGSMATVFYFGGHCLAHCQMPVMQSNTTPKALINHRRSMEDSFVTSNLDVTLPVTLHFQKPADATAQDKRRLSQLCLAVSSDSEKLQWNVPPVISSIPLIKVADMKGYDEGTKPSPAVRAEQKGTLAHEKILAAYFNGMTWGHDQKVMIFDLVPNRQCEFGRAALERALGNVVPKVYYMGIMRPDMKSVVQDLEQQVYKHWDGSRESGPKQRPRSEQEQPSLSILRWADGVPKLPEQVLSSFPAESSQHAEIVKMEAALNNLWPAPAAVPRAESAQGPVRTPAVPDFTDSTVLDVNREISLAHVAAAGFQVDRLAFCQGKQGRPSILISKDFDIYLGNLEDEEMVCMPGEVHGFFTGSFESKIVQGLGEREASTIPFRIESDLTFVAHNKKLMMLCEYVCHLAREEGLVDVQLEDHQMKPKMRVSADGGGQELPVPFRYDISPVDSKKTACYKPNAVAANFDHENHRAATLGAVYVGQCNRVPVQHSNKRLALVWEVAVITGSSAPKVAPVKPKVYLTCQLRLPAQTYTKVT